MITRLTRAMWVLAHRTFQLASWIERFEPKPETIDRAEKLRLIEGEG